MRYLIGVAAAVLLLCGLAITASACDPALRQVAPDSMPFFMDDAGWQDLQKSVERSMTALAGIDKEQLFVLCGRSYPASWLQQSMAVFLRGLQTYPAEADFRKFLSANFDVCQTKGSDGAGRMLVTGYYEPFLAGSLTRQSPFVYPLYQVPPDLVVPAGNLAGNEGGRMEDGRFVPYWTRAEIETGDLLQGQEIVYLADPLDVFILQVQGSGRIRLPDGSVRKVHFAASNGRRYLSIGRLLVDRGVMSLEEVTMPKIVSYLHDHPDEMQDILRHNDRYIFFSISPAGGETDNEGPAGSLGQPLTAGRSLAVDGMCFPVPMVGYLETALPVFADRGAVIGWKPLRRFVVNQDSGAAIKGPGRADLFLGGDEYAARAAGVMKQPGALYFLVLKEEKM
ncbi:MAG: MltA domain-containing protein [Thermodesulfobacteriota bacterium]